MFHWFWHLLDAAPIQTGLQHQVEQAKRQVKQFESSIQTTKERHAERQKKGRDDRKSGRQGDKLLAGSMKNSSENTQSRNRSLAELRICHRPWLLNH